MKSFARKFLLVLFVTELVWAALLAFAPSSGQMRLFFVDEHGSAAGSPAQMLFHRDFGVYPRQSQKKWDKGEFAARG